MTDQQQLEALLATHAGLIRAQLPEHLHHLAPFKTEKFGLLTKYTLGEARPGVWAMLHRLEGSDSTPWPHDHPCRFDSYGIKGSYWEHSYHEDGRTELTLRAATGRYTIWPHTIHEVVGVLDGPAWTLVFAYDVVQEPRHYPELAQAA
jgi:hypothetical protein